MEYWKHNLTTQELLLFKVQHFPFVLKDPTGSEFKGTIPPKMYQEIFFLLPMKYQHVADVVVEFYSCETCENGVLEV